MTPSEKLLTYFNSSHLSKELQSVVAPFQELANQIVLQVPESAEKTVGIRKLLEAKDCIVRASLD